jgi:hypothetical protein
VAFVGLRGSRYGIYRKPATGEGEEELIYQHAGGPIVLTDWSLDGGMLSFYATDLSGSTLYLVPVDGDRKPIEVTHSESQVVAARLSQTAGGWPIDPTRRTTAIRFSSAPPGSRRAEGRTVGNGRCPLMAGEGMVWWRRDGRSCTTSGRSAA